MKTNNNPNWLITKDLAKKLKEIGYKEQCLFVFMPKDEKIGFTTERQRHYNFINGIDKNICDDNSIFYPAVTWTEVLEWFRKRNLVGLVTHCYRSKNDNGFSFEILDEDADVFLYKTYEQAQEALVYRLIDLYKKINNIKNEE